MGRLEATDIQTGGILKNLVRHQFAFTKIENRELSFVLIFPQDSL